ncbi:olfactory receptor 2AP1-like [Heteronotia binoei]|uniref:olfactory receptor 2AP1-like n=1 Tax=Heteronotia binoei TaxID=13085 RepID=UPI00292EA07E|nr:olfactory receptor 2AP1-like [Heteronotia binoei]
MVVIACISSRNPLATPLNSFLTIKRDSHAISSSSSPGPAGSATSSVPTVILTRCMCLVKMASLRAAASCIVVMHRVEKSEWQNRTAVTSLILLGFGYVEDLNVLLFFLFLAIYLVIMSGNLLIVVLVMVEQHLHTPMYFFLANLSFLESCYTSTILPRMLASFVTRDKTISLLGCVLQMHFFSTMAATECYLLAAMSYDRYLAICKPLHYATLMNERKCILLVSVSWIIGLLLITILTCFLSQLNFCNQYTIDHFFCDFTPIVRLSCSDTKVVETAAFITSSIGILPTFLITLASYVFIITTILKIPSITGRQKAFSTCSSHLTVVSIFYGSLMFVYVLPTMEKFKDLNKVLSFLYTVLTPMVNPFIYSLRNKEVQGSLIKAVYQFRGFSRIQKK